MQALARGSGSHNIVVECVKRLQVLFILSYLFDISVFFFLLCRIGKNTGNGARKTSTLLPQAKRMKRCCTTCTWRTTAPHNRESEDFVLLAHCTCLFQVKKYLSSSLFNVIFATSSPQCSFEYVTEFPTYLLCLARETPYRLDSSIKRAVNQLLFLPPHNPFSLILLSLAPWVRRLM